MIISYKSERYLDSLLILALNWKQYTEYTYIDLVSIKTPLITQIIVACILEASPVFKLLFVHEEGFLNEPKPK